jgi:hypothetical protein
MIISLPRAGKKGSQTASYFKDIRVTFSGYLYDQGHYIRELKPIRAEDDRHQEDDEDDHQDQTAATATTAAPAKSKRALQPIKQYIQ